MKYLAVKDYARHQHYRDRNPVWIKLYNAVMDDEAFLALPDAARGHLILIWLLASRRNNKLPNDARLIGRAIQATGRVNIAQLVSAGFLIPWSESGAEPAADAEHPASNVLAEPEQNAIPEREEEKEIEKRENLTTHAAGANAEAEAALRAAMGAAMEAVDRFLATRPARSRANWYPELLRIIGPAMSAKPADLAGACTDALIVDPPVTTPHALRAFVQKQMQVRTSSSIVKLPVGGSSKSATDPVAEAAWQATIALLPKWQRREVTADTFAEMAPAMRAAISSIGGFQALGQTPDDRRVWLKKDFLAAYQRAANEHHAVPPEAQSA